ncbi:MAG: SH3 domain-containing protein [Lachnospiraceae bacterium]|nr:SH3 domain-containing protein [Lachnospiraceae bacterium]
MKKLSIILTLIFTLSLYGCGEQETAVNEVQADAVVESDSSDIMDDQAKEQTPSDEQKQDDNEEVENVVSDDTNEAETADENKDTNAESDAAGNGTADNETANNKAADNEVAEEAVLEYTVTTYDESQVMYASGPVNVRKGPSTDFERVGALKYGQEITVTGQADTNWYEIMYGEEKAYVSNKYLQNDKPADESQAAAVANPQTESDAQSQTQQSTPEIQPVTEVKNVAGVILVGDSRFVQMQENVGANSCTWIAENSKGYAWFEEKAIPRIDGCVGSGSKILINLGVNDPGNHQKYIALVNAKAAEWTALGATVYYASVNPVWENPYVTEEQVKYFNSQMQNGLSADVHWIDSHSYITSIGYKLVDGLHYNSETYQNLYAYFMSCM